MSPVNGATVYTGNTVVGTGAAANLTATQILQNSLSIGDGASVTIVPSSSGSTSASQTAVSDSFSAETGSATASAGSASDGGIPMAVVESAIASGSISGALGRRLETRIAEIQYLEATKPGLDVSSLESEVLAALPTLSASSFTDFTPPATNRPDPLTLDSSQLETAANAASATFTSGSNADGPVPAVPEPSTLLLSAIAMAVACGLVLRRGSKVRPIPHG